MRVLGPRVTLRYPEPDDAPALLELGADPEVTRFFSWGPYERLDQPLAYIASLERQRREADRLEFLVELRGEGPVGITGLSEFSARDRRAVVGTWFGRRYWGTGLNAESKALILALAFGPLGLARATALAHPDNLRSLAALERVGFRREGLLRAWQWHRGTPQDCAILGLLREEWERLPLHGVEVRFEGDPPSRFRVAARPPEGSSEAG